MSIGINSRRRADLPRPLVVLTVLVILAALLVPIVVSVVQLLL